MANDIPKPRTVAAPPRKRQITILADFPSPWGGDIRAEIAAIKKSSPQNPTWSPSIVDFREVLEADTLKDFAPEPLECNSVSTFFGIIQSFSPGSLAIVNVITHSNIGVIGVGGKVDRAGGVTWRIMGENDGMNPAAFQESQVINTNVVDFLNITDMGKGIRNDLRTRFAANAEIRFYSCEGATGVAQEVLRNLSRSLNVNIRGFREYVEYKPLLNAPGDAISSRAPTRYESKPIQERTTEFKNGFLHLEFDFATGMPSTPTP